MMTTIIRKLAVNGISANQFIAFGQGTSGTAISMKIRLEFGPRLLIYVENCMAMLGDFKSILWMAFPSMHCSTLGFMMGFS